MIQNNFMVKSNESHLYEVVDNKQRENDSEKDWSRVADNDNCWDCWKESIEPTTYQIRKNGVDLNNNVKPRELVVNVVIGLLQHRKLGSEIKETDL